MSLYPPGLNSPVVGSVSPQPPTNLYIQPGASNLNSDLTWNLSFAKSKISIMNLMVALQVLRTAQELYIWFVYLHTR